MSSALADVSCGDARSDDPAFRVPQWASVQIDRDQFASLRQPLGLDRTRAIACSNSSRLSSGMKMSNWRPIASAAV
jgi:hypothetical protein